MPPGIAFKKNILERHQSGLVLSAVSSLRDRKAGSFFCNKLERFKRNLFNLDDEIFESWEVVQASNIFLISCHSLPIRALTRPCSPLWKSTPIQPNNTVSVTTTVSSLPTVTFVATDPQATEQVGNRGQFTVYRSGDTSKSLTVKYMLSGTATNGNDYTWLWTTVTLAAGRSSAIATVIPRDDRIKEGEERVQLTVAPGTLYPVGAPEGAVVSIADND